jgi:hypothetical protein
MLDDHLKLRRRELVSGSEGPPLSLLGLVRRELVGQADRCACRQRRAPACERCLDGLALDRDIQIRMPRQHPQVEEVLHSAVRDAERRDCLELLGDRLPRQPSAIWVKESRAWCVLEQKLHQLSGSRSFGKSMSLWNAASCVSRSCRAQDLCAAVAGRATLFIGAPLWHRLT